jgi:hypothetical protein
VKRIAVAAGLAGSMLVITSSASAVTLKTNWAERTQLSSGGTYMKQGPRKTLVHGPGIWFGQYNELSTTHQFKLPRRL